MTNARWIGILLLCTLQVASLYGHAQLTQQIRGTVTDQLLQTPLPGATVSLTGTNLKTITNEEGKFLFAQVPVGTYQIEVSYVGYRNAHLNNLVLITGKQLVVQVGMELAVAAENTVFVKGRSNRNRPVNDRSLVSTRAFTVEETQKYAAAVNDPLRMATNYAGVVGADDGNNHIIIRGNAPTGLLWRMEGIDVPNPNHFAAANSSGGGISILSAALLSNSDFITGAWASEYGNALSGAFDLKLRKGNNQRHEYTLQAGVLGLNVAAEGPLKLGRQKGSFLVNYRYSTLELLSKLGIGVGSGVLDFQDLSYNIQLPTANAGSFTLFGFNGHSSQTAKAAADSSKWETEDDRYGYRFGGTTRFNGATHQIRLGRNSLLKSALGYSYVKSSYHESYINELLNTQVQVNDRNVQQKVTFTSTLNQRISNNQSLRTGVIINHIHFNLYQQHRPNLSAPIATVLNNGGNTQTVQAFAEVQSRPTGSVTLNAGLHYLQLLLNHAKSLEPRLAAKWEVSRTGTVTLGYGLHSQMQGMGVYFAQHPDGSGQATMPNKHLGFTKAHHWVAGFQQQLGTHLRIRTELYYQHLFKVPVGNADTSTLSALNLRDGYITDAMVNKGSGRNYGMEITLERHLHNHFYLMWSNSLYQSKYRALDGIERNTRWNGNYATTLVTGKDFVSQHGNRVISINLKMVRAGGFRQTPLDLPASVAAGYGKYKEQEAFTQQLPAYFRTDLRLSIQWNRTRRTSTLSLDLQNVTNRQNLFGNYYDPRKQVVVNSYQTGLIPVLNYKVELW